MPNIEYTVFGSSIVNDVRVTVDVVAFAIEQDCLEVLLIKRKYEPFRNQWALPGGFLLPGDGSLEEAAARELSEETNVSDIYLEQLYSFGDRERDPRGRTVTIAYLALLRAEEVELQAATDASGVAWFPVHSLPDLAFDHGRILDYAISRLRYKIEYSPCVFSLLPESFTLRSLQNAYEIILGKQIDNRNFRKKFLGTGILIDQEELTRGGPHRPAKLYKFSLNEFSRLADRPIFTF
ncbi:MAG TPA: NUDIX domain-containing protein [Candidatus Melainabacteria bacterium]|nr:NUDIX domain-containing protein [Candidatus Melainabacteria bacterium]HMP50154.1 NUDIX domain-containing protein [Candidatus Melainabacteria bacterium]